MARMNPTAVVYGIDVVAALVSQARNNVLKKVIYYAVLSVCDYFKFMRWQWFSKSGVFNV